jgi:hypothetical protein
MTRWLLLAGGVAAAAVGAYLLLRGGGSSAPPTTIATTTTTTTTAATTSVQTWFYRGNALVPVRTEVARTQAIGTAAVDALLAGPPSGRETEIPAGTQLVGLSIAGDTATATLSPGFAGAPRTARAQVVYTLTQFPTVREVELVAGSSRLHATRADYADLTPAAPIFVASPLRGATVTSPVHAAGTAIVFEATLVLEVRAGGKLVHRETITASRGGPYRGTWSATVALAPGAYDLVFYEPSAENGEPLHTTTVPITVTG